jgi:DNA-binding Lrp family transcriptional regulator
MDITDIEILSVLLDNCRTSNNKISQITGISSMSVASRIQKMLDSKLITKFSLSIEPLAFGYNIVYFVTVGQNWKNILEKLKLIGQPYFAVPCIGGVTICSILTNEPVSKVTNIAQKLLDDVRILNIFEAPSFDIYESLTKTDLKILKILIADPRAKIDNISKKANFSTKTISRSLEKLQNNEIIHFTLEFDPTKLKNFISFAILVNVIDDVKRTLYEVQKNIGKSFLQKPWISKNQFVIFLYGDNIYKLDEITTTVKNTIGVESTDLFMPKMTAFPQEWIHNGIDVALQTPKLHVNH